MSRNDKGIICAAKELSVAVADYSFDIDGDELLDHVADIISAMAEILECREEGSLGETMWKMMRNKVKYELIYTKRTIEKIENLIDRGA